MNVSYCIRNLKKIEVYMKKTLLSCVALSVFLSWSVLAQETPKTSNATTPETKEQTKNTSEPTVQQNNETPDSLKKESTSEQDTFVQAELEAAFQSFLSDGGLESDTPLIFEQRGQDYIVTIPQLKVPVADGHKVLPTQRVTLIRNGDFAGSPQFQVKMDFLTKIQSILKLISDNTTVDADRYVQDMLWVPRLQMISNNSIQAENLTLSFPEHLTANIKSMVSDVLVQPVKETGRMDIAAATDSYDITISTPIGQITLPRISYHKTLVGTEISGDEALQTLTADRGSTLLNIPQFNVSSALLPNQELSGHLTATAQFLPTQAQLNLTLDSLKLTQDISPLIPEKIVLNIIFDNLKQPDLIHLWHTQKQIQNLIDSDKEVSDELEHQLDMQLQKVLGTTTIRIPEINISNARAGIKMAGVIDHLTSDPQVDLTLSITNFDLISPPSKKIDTEKCTALVQQVSENQNDSSLVHQMQTECMPQTGILEDLRPYLSTATHSTNEAGISVDTFFISSQNGMITVNGQQIKETTLPINALKPTEMKPETANNTDTVKNKSDSSEASDQGTSAVAEKKESVTQPAAPQND